MSDVRGTKTEADLQESFAGESQANRKYLAFAEAADCEGFAQVAKLFRAAAAAETIHAHAHLRAMGGIGSILENLKEAVSGETHEFKEMYPPMIEEAKAKGFKAAERTLAYANEVEKVHAGLYQKALDNQGKIETVDYYVCKVCGNTLEGPPEGPCSVCKAAKTAFFKVD